MSTTTQWHPLRGLKYEAILFQRELNRLLDRWGIGLPDLPTVKLAHPSMNVWEDESFVYAEAELPGLKLPDLEITVTPDNQLTLKGRRPTAPHRLHWHRQEIESGRFERTIELPAPVDADKIEARLAAGVLSIKMAKCPTVKPRKIPVKAG